MLARRLVVCATSVPLLGGCLLLGDHDGEGDEPRPELVAISRDEVRVGQRLEFLGEELDDSLSLAFDGEFRGDDGSIHRVDLTYLPEHVVDDRVIIPYFGPYDAWFGDGDASGVFTGTITPMGSAGHGRPFDLELRVLPSIIVRELASSDITCAQPSRVLLSGGRLHLVAEAIGIDATEIAVRLGDAPVVTSPDGVLEVDIPALAADTLFAVTELELSARTAGGEVIESEYLIGIHREIEYIDFGRQQLAQIEEPVAVSGCFSGGDTQGRTIEYGEDATDERVRTVGYTWNEVFLEEIGGEPDDLAGLTELGLRRVVEGPRVGADVDTWTVGDQLILERTGRPAFPAGDPTFWDVSSVALAGDAEGFILPGMFGVWYRQATRVAHPATIAFLDACGEPSVAAEAMAFDYTWDVELAVGEECPPFPEPSLPEAECFIAPCQ